MCEIWQEIPSIPGAFASSDGRVWFPSKAAVPMPGGGFRDYKTKPVRGHEVKKNTNRPGSSGHYIRRWRGKTYKIHRLICEAFHGPPPDARSIVLHLNEDPSDNRPQNLRWGTRKENQNFPKAKAAFRARVGERSPTIIHRRKMQEESDVRTQ